jgi:hypothetical protein
MNTLALRTTLGIKSTLEPPAVILRAQNHHQSRNRQFEEHPLNPYFASLLRTVRNLTAFVPRSGPTRDSKMNQVSKLSPWLLRFGPGAQVPQEPPDPARPRRMSPTRSTRSAYLVRRTRRERDSTGRRPQVPNTGDSRDHNHNHNHDGGNDSPSTSG